MARSVLRLKPWLPQQPFICLDHGHLLSVHSLCQPARNSLLGQRTIIRVTTTRFPHSTCQFLDMSRTRIESLLASFPKLLPPPSSTQHTLIETPDVRYVHQPLEELYILLITNKASNLLRDIDMLHLLVRVASDMCQSAAESEVATRALELLGAFDKVVGIENYEEKIQEIIARVRLWKINSGFSLSGYGGGIIGYSPVPTSYTPPPPTVSTPINLNTGIGARAPSFRASGIKLGSKKTKQAELIDALGGDYMASGIGLTSEPPTPSVAAAPQTVQSTNKGRGACPKLYQKGLSQTLSDSLSKLNDPHSINISIAEQITCSLLRDGGLEKDIELKGDMNLLISDPTTDDSNSLVAALQFKQHPQVAKFDAKANRNEAKKIALRDASKTFLINQNLALTLRSKLLAHTFKRCVAPHGLEIFIPLPAGSYPTVSSHTGEWSLEPNSNSLAWTTAIVDGGIIAKLFTVEGDDPETFFPVRVAFVGKGSLAGVGIAQTSLEDGADAVFSVDSVVTADGYFVV
ncbi:Copper P-type ATPase [Mycena indigotica]|uniref:Coatomer subunit delta n=1 Tax=Mycena indigotica TaxID=2126181 RepID=A0A8H6S653_9AGAR|nr:Copper P-type ATPase [Mycena indigotica]KAF7293488.1 Copper P-type ATPase [Mycena indigotica]